MWVAVPEDAPKETFSSELKQARNSGVGVLQIMNAGDPHEFHRAVPLSLFALARTDLKLVPPNRREVFKDAEALFLDGAPDQACHAICQEIELISRQFAEHTHNKGWWTSPKKATAPLAAKFFAKDPWATMLETMERRADVVAIRGKSPGLQRQIVVRTRAFTDWRNDVSHKPKNPTQLKARDAKLRTMFEATRDLLVDWYRVAKPLGLVK